MAIQHMDFPSGAYGLWGLGSPGELEDGVYANAVVAASELQDGCYIVTDRDTNITGACLKVTADTTNGYREMLRYVLSSQQAVVGIAARVWYANLPTQNTATPITFSFNNAANSRMVWVTVYSTGSIHVKYDQADTGEEYTTPGPCIVPGTWHHWEVKCDFANGTIEIRIDGVTKVSITGADIGDVAGAHQVAMGSYNFNTTLQSPNALYYKDLVIWDGSGTENNDFLGSVQVYDLTPISDASFNWTASTGSTGYNLIDEAGSNDADYIYADDTPPAASVFELSDLPVDVTSIRGLKTFVRALKTDGGDGQMQVSMVSNGDEANGTDRPITTNFTYWSDVFEIDPDTSLAWSRSGVNAAQLKIDRTI